LNTEIFKYFTALTTSVVGYNYDSNSIRFEFDYISIWLLSTFDLTTVRLLLKGH